MSISNTLRLALPATLALFLALSLAACGGGASGGQSGIPGEVINADFSYPAGDFPVGFTNPAGFTVDSNSGGDAQELRLLQSFWGRLVDVYDFDSATGERGLRNHNYVIGEQVQSDGLDYLLETNPATNVVSLTILHKAGTAAYISAFESLDNDLGPVQPKSLSVQELPPFSLVPRNAALVLQFSDLLDHDSVNRNTIRVLTGYTPIEVFEPRLLLDPNFGGLVNAAGGKEFRTTRVIVDMTVSDFESASTSPPLPVNALGLPGSLNTATPNLALRLPSTLDFAGGVFQVLTNLSGHRLSLSSNGPVDFGVASLDVVRAMRSGGSTSVTGDENNGFLFDNQAPRLVGQQTVVISALAADPANGANAYVLNVQFSTIACARTLQVGDVIQQPGVFAQISQPATAPVGGAVSNVRVELLTDDPSSFFNGLAVYLGTFDPLVDLDSCFVTFTPDAALPPFQAVDPSASVALRFSEPMDPATFQELDTFRILRDADGDGIQDAGEINTPSRTNIIPCQLNQSTDLRVHTLQPVLPLNHVSGTAESFFLQLATGSKAPTDLAGNALAAELDEVTFALDSTASTAREGSLVLRFTSTDEDGNGLPELRGQFVIDTIAGLIRPRSVERFPLVADRQNTVPAFMTANALGVSEPMAKYGSRLMSVWRYVDLGIPAIDENLYNLDIEGINFSPLAGNVTSEFFEHFEMRLGHSVFFPDEAFDPLTLAPLAPASGLASTSFAENILGGAASGQTVVHGADEGYLLSALDAFISGSNTPMAPFPMNLGKPLSEYQHFTWRDTTVTQVGGPNGTGVEPGILGNIGLPIAAIAPVDAVPSILLPLLMEFRATPSDTAQGTNRLDSSFASPGGARVPFFRVFSSGGSDITGAIVKKVPELEFVPSGGFNNTNNPTFGANGAPTPAGDDLWTLGQLDCVVRISRVHTVWFDTGVNTPGFPVYADPLVLPKPEDQPDGSSVVLAFRGYLGSSLPALSGVYLTNASCLDVYGDRPGPQSFIGTCPADPNIFADPTTKNPTSQIDEDGWVDDVSGISGTLGARFFQVRISFVNNTSTGLAPTLSGLGFSYTKP